jgi:sugar lactone lactonase YvrE
VVNNNSLLVYSAGSNGNVAPSAAISTNLTTGLFSPRGIALDSNGSVYVAGFAYPDDPGVFVYPAGSNGNAAPVATISGGNTRLSNPRGITLDSTGNIYVVDADAGVLVYPAGSSGDVAPSANIPGFGSDTGLINPQGIALDSSRNIYVADSDAGVLIYPAGSSGDVSPSGTIPSFGANDDLTYPAGIALDSSDNIYVTGENANTNAASVFVYSAGSNSDVAPTAIISGSNTALSAPQGIALDSSRNIYVANASDLGEGGSIPDSVFVYSAGSNSDVFPTATISGPHTELGEILGVAIQPIPPAPVPVKLKISTASLNFGTVKVGSHKGPENITVSNPKGSKKKPGLTVLMGGLSGGVNPFSVTNRCDAPLPAGEKCKIGVTFTPNTAGSYYATLMIIDNAEHEPQPVKLKGKGKVK